MQIDALHPIKKSIAKAMDFLHSLFFVSSKTVSRVMSRIIIYLILLLPTDFSDPPKSVTGSHIAFYSVLLRMGFTYALSVTRKAVVSYTALPPLPAKAGGIFLLHYPWSRLHRTLSGILPCEARTFLTWINQPRSSTPHIRI